MEGVKKVASIVCEVLPQNRLVGERHEKDFVVFVNPVSEPIHRIHSGTELSVHAAADIQQHTDADGHTTVLAEMRNFLGPAVFLDDEVFGRQGADITAAIVSHRRDDVDQPNVNADLRPNNVAC